MGTQPKCISVDKFKSRCLSLLENVSRTRQPIIVTKDGRPFAKVIPTESRKARKLLGSVKFHGDIVDPVLGKWDIE